MKFNTKFLVDVLIKGTKVQKDLEGSRVALSFVEIQNWSFLEGSRVT